MVCWSRFSRSCRRCCAGPASAGRVVAVPSAGCSGGGLTLWYRWRCQGLKQKRRQLVRVGELDDGQLIPDVLAERVLPVRIIVAMQVARPLRHLTQQECESRLPGFFGNLEL